MKITHATKSIQQPIELHVNLDSVFGSKLGHSDVSGDHPDGFDRFKENSISFIFLLTIYFVAFFFNVAQYI